MINQVMARRGLAKKHISPVSGGSRTMSSVYKTIAPVLLLL